MEECDPYSTLMDDDIYHGEDDLSKQALFGNLWILSKAVCETQSAVDRSILTTRRQAYPFPASHEMQILRSWDAKRLIIAAC